MPKGGLKDSVWASAGLLAAVGSYPDDFVFFRLEDFERARCHAQVAAVCVAETTAVN